MPAPAPFASAQPLYPALYLYPLNDSFIPKHIYLPPNTKVKIGRQTNAKTAPGERNGYFDSKVLSRQHAEVWEENGKIYIRDVKSSNGTFINGDRLSGEGMESEPYDLKSDDIVEFGIDIVGEDNKTIIHHKVSARVVCIFSEHDAQVALRAEQLTQQQQQHLQPQQHQQQYPGPSSSFNFNGNPPPRRQVGGPGPGAPQQNGPANQLGSLGGPNMRPPGKSTISFEHILNRLQGELQKSRETGAELHTITGAMSDIHDTLGGNLPPNAPPYPHSLPPVRPPQPPSNGDGNSQQQQQTSASPEPQPPRPSSSHGSPDSMQVTLSGLEKEVTVAQSSLLAQMEKLHEVLDEQEKIRDEVRRLREVVYVEHAQEKHDEEEERGSGFDEDDEGEGESMDDDDDARSVATLVPHELERVDEVDEEHLENADDEHREDEQRRDDNLALGRPRTPEPTHLGMRDRQPHQPSPLSNDVSISASIDDLAARMSDLTAQLESALALSNSLHAKHAEAQETIQRLEQKIGVLETMLTSKAEPTPAPAPEPAPAQSEEVSKILSNYKAAFDQQFAAMREEWNAERERMRAVEERVAASASSSHPAPLLNGDGASKLTGGLVTPPSPRSPARKRRSGSRRRSRSASRSEEGLSDAESVSTGATKVEAEGREKGFSDAGERGLVTPEHSLRGGLPGFVSAADGKDELRKGVGFRDGRTAGSPANAQAAVGVLVLSIAAAAVIWRVKD